MKSTHGKSKRMDDGVWWQKGRERGTMEKIKNEERRKGGGGNGEKIYGRKGRKICR